MRVLGITGGVGSGKSQVLKLLETEYGAVVVQLDEVAKRLQQSGEPCFEQIVKCFGAGVVGADGELDRAALGRMVFADKEKLQMLNTIVHPAVKQWVEKDVAEKRREEAFARRQEREVRVGKSDGRADGKSGGRSGRKLDGKSGGGALYAIEAALLPGNGYEQICDEMWYIYAGEAVRRKRLESSRGYTEEQITRMMAAQPDEETFRKTCQVVIDNGGTFEETRRAIGAFHFKSVNQDKTVHERSEEGQI